MKCSVLLIICVANFFYFEVIAAAPKLENSKLILTLKEEVTVTDNKIWLKDVVENIDELESKIGMHNKISNLWLRNSPRIGYQYKLSKIEIARILKEKLGNIDNFMFEGNKYVTVTAKGVLLKKEIYISRAESVLHERLKQIYTQYEVALHGQYKDLEVPTGDLAIDIRFRNARTAKTKIIVWVDIKINNEFYKSIPVWFTSHLYNKVMVARQTTLRNSNIEMNTINTELREVSLVTGAAISVQNKRNLKAIRKIEIGDVLTTKNTRYAPVVSRHQYIKLSISNGGIGITKRVISQQDANIGDVITVRGEKADEIYDVVVKSKSEGVPVWCEQKPTPYCL